MIIIGLTLLAKQFKFILYSIYHYHKATISMNFNKVSTASVLIVFAMVMCVAFSQGCRNNKNWNVDWWVMMRYPGSLTPGYAYYDSRQTTANLSVFAQPADDPTSPLGITFTQINTIGMMSISWNDQIPNGANSSTKAHSKSVVAFDNTSNTGFMIVHSIPQYPLFTGKVINITIASGQSIYGQHILCISGTKQGLATIINKIKPIRPQTYAYNYDNQYILNQVLNTGVAAPNTVDLFSYNNYTTNGSQILMIFKNGYKNGSIFEDGVNNMLNSSLLSQTWGRPLQAPWCGGKYTTGNIMNVTIAPNISWGTTQDHSKWMIATNAPYSCFGDMNRMSSQWARGGAFYCIKSTNLNLALKGIVKITQTC